MFSMAEANKAYDVYEGLINMNPNQIEIICENLVHKYPSIAIQLIGCLSEEIKASGKVYP